MPLTWADGVRGEPARSATQHPSPGPVPPARSPAGTGRPTPAWSRRGWAGTC